MKKFVVLYLVLTITSILLVLFLYENLLTKIKYSEEIIYYLKQENEELQRMIKSQNETINEKLEEINIYKKESEKLKKTFDEALQTCVYGRIVYLGKFKLTAYCCEPYNHICGSGDGLTALGIDLMPGIVAVDESIIPLGSTVVINGKSYLAADTGGKVKGKHIDIAFLTHNEALEFGTQSGYVYVIN